MMGYSPTDTRGPQATKKTTQKKTNTQKKQKKKQKQKTKKKQNKKKTQATITRSVTDRSTRRRLPAMELCSLAHLLHRPLRRLSPADFAESTLRTCHQSHPPTVTPTKGRLVRCTPSTWRGGRRIPVTGNIALFHLVQEQISNPSSANTTC